MFLISFVKTELMMPSKLPSSIDWQNNDTAFALISCWHTISAAYLILLLSTVEFFGPNLFMILHAYMDILERRVSRIGWDLNKTDYELWETFRSDMKSCIQYHNMCIRFLNVCVDYSISNSFFVLTDLLNI